MDLLLQAAAQPHVDVVVTRDLSQWTNSSPRGRKRARDEHVHQGLSLLSRSASRRGGLGKRDTPSRHAMIVSTQPGAAHYRSLAHLTSFSPQLLVDDDDDCVVHQQRSSLVDGVPQPLLLAAPAQPLLYEDLINFPRARGKTHARRCVMCGHLATGEGATCSIPLQNKDVCKRCDTGIWRHKATTEYFKWCKGCKKFLHVCSFAEKLSKCTTKYSKQPSKCDRCRERGRQSYMSKRLEADASAQPPPGMFTGQMSRHQTAAAA